MSSSSATESSLRATYDEKFDSAFSAAVALTHGPMEVMQLLRRFGFSRRSKVFEEIVAVCEAELVQCEAEYDAAVRHKDAVRASNYRARMGAWRLLSDKVKQRKGYALGYELDSAAGVRRQVS